MPPTSGIAAVTAAELNAITAAASLHCLGCAGKSESEIQSTLSALFLADGAAAGAGGTPALAGVKWSITDQSDPGSATKRVVYARQPAAAGSVAEPLLVDWAPAFAADGTALAFVDSVDRTGSGSRAGSGASDASAGVTDNSVPRLVPTVQALWRAPGLLPHLLIPPHASPLVLAGFAMWEDIYTSALPRLPEGALVAIRVVGNPAPIAVGVLAESTDAAAVANFRGPAVVILDKYCGDAAAAAAAPASAGAVGGASAASGAGVATARHRVSVPNEGFLPGEVRPVAAGREELERFLALPSSALGGIVRGSVAAGAPSAASAASFAAAAAPLATAVAAAGKLSSSIRGYLPPLAVSLCEPQPVTYAILRTVLRPHPQPDAAAAPGAAGGAGAVVASVPGVAPWQPTTDLRVRDVKLGTAAAKEAVCRMALAAGTLVAASSTSASAPASASASATASGSDSGSDLRSRLDVDGRLYSRAELEAAFRAYITVRGLRRAAEAHAAAGAASAEADGGSAAIAASSAGSAMVRVDPLLRSLFENDSEDDLDLDFEMFGDGESESASGSDDDYGSDESEDDEEEEDEAEAGLNVFDDPARAAAARSAARSGSGRGEQLMSEEKLLRAFMACVRRRAIIVIANPGMVAAARLLPAETGCASAAGSAAVGYLAGYTTVEGGGLPVVSVIVRKQAEGAVDGPRRSVFVKGLEAYGIRESTFRRELTSRSVAGSDYFASPPVSRSASADSAVSTGTAASAASGVAYLGETAAIESLLTSQDGFGLPADAVVVTEQIRRPRVRTAKPRIDLRLTPEGRAELQDKREARLELLRSKGRLNDHNTKKGKAALRW